MDIEHYFKLVSKYEEWIDCPEDAPVLTIEEIDREPWASVIYKIPCKASRELLEHATIAATQCTTEAFAYALEKGLAGNGSHYWVKLVGGSANKRVYHLIGRMEALERERLAEMHEVKAAGWMEQDAGVGDDAEPDADLWTNAEQQALQQQEARRQSYLERRAAETDS